MSNWRVETALYQGARSSQQDFVARLRTPGDACVIGLLSDGIGGHGNGDVASRMAVETCAETLAPEIPGFIDGSVDVPALLLSTAHAANTRISGAIRSQSRLEGMGATLLIAVVVRNRLFWCSVGDSHLWVHHNGKLTRMNADHSLASGLGNLVKIGAINSEDARKSPKNSVLTSSLSGRDLKEIVCPADGVKLRADSQILLFSDGIESLQEDEMKAICQRRRSPEPAALCADFIDAVIGKADPAQDNLAVIAIA
jgi:serine/threonine protein phosphatase PrpC